MNHKPYVSVVIVGRNDSYGKDFLSRINTFVRSLDHQVSTHPGIFELIVVEWNPLNDHAPLAEVLEHTTNLPITVITVPDHLHDTLGASSPVLEFHGKNVGIRRAHGEFVLVTNPDILFSQALIDDIAKKNLRLDTVYRTDRYDFQTQGITNVDSSDLIDFAVKNAFVVHGMSGQNSVSVAVQEHQRDLSLLPRSDVTNSAWHTNGSGDFILAAKEVFFTVRGLYETVQHRWHVDSISLMRFRAAQIQQHIFVAPHCVFHQHHDRRPEDVSFANLDVLGLAQQPGSTEWGFRDHDLVTTTKDLV